MGLPAYDSARDRLISLGDVIDRGPESQGCIEFLRDAGAVVLLGNHEAMMMAAQPNFGAAEVWRMNGGAWGYGSDVSAWCDWALMLPLTATLILHDGRRIGLVHAQAPVGLPWEQATRIGLGPEHWMDADATAPAAQLIWGRSRFRAAHQLNTGFKPRSFAEDASLEILADRCAVVGIHRVIAGHSVPFDGLPLAQGNCLWIDTGAGVAKIGGRLTVADPAAGLYWQSFADGRVTGPEVLP